LIILLSFLFPETLLSAQDSLESSTIPSESLRVTVTGLPLPVAHIGDSLSVISSKMMSKNHTTFLTQELQRVPGLYTSQDGGSRGISSVRIRGQNREDTLLVIDGMIVTDPSAPQPVSDFSRLMVDGEHEVSVLRGSQGVLYGTQAVGGVVSLVSPRAHGPIRGSLVGDGGSYETNRIGINAHGGLENNRFGYRFSLQNFFTQGLSSARTFWPSRDENDKFRLRYGYGRFDYDISPTMSLKAVAYGTGGRSHYDWCAGPDLKCDAPGLYDDFSNSAGRLSAHTTSDTGNIKGEFGLTYNLGERRGFLWDRPTYNFQGSMFLADGKLTVSVSPDHTLVAGLENRIDQAIAQGGYGSTSSGGSVGTQSLFMLSQSALSSEVDMALGGRVDHYGSFGAFPTYRGSLAYRPSALNAPQGWDVRLTSALASGFRVPSVYELYGVCCGGKRIGNPALMPEMSRSWDAGLHLASPAKQLSASLTYFRLLTLQDIVWDRQRETYKNSVGQIHVQGAETEFSWQIAQGISLNQAYTYTQAIESPKEPLPCRPMHISSTFLNTSFHEKRGNAIFSGIYVVGNKTLKSKLPPNLLLNAAVEYAVAQNFMVYGRVDNISNESYETCTGYQNEGRMVRIGLKVTF
jgi:vitamin B12 transporter